VHLVDESAIARGMVRVEPGDDVLGALEALAFAAGWREAHVSGAGRFDLVELVQGDETSSLEHAEIVTLNGLVVRSEARAEARLFAQLFADGRVHVGRVVAALGGEALLVVDASVARSAKPVARETRSRPVVPTAEPVPPSRGSSPGLGSGLVAKPMLLPVGRAEAAAAADDVEEHWAEVASGDVLIHPQLGTCDVVGEDESGGMRVRIASGRICVLRLDTLEIAAPNPDASGRSVYRVIGPKRRR
jgi:hypothetical protein